MSYDNLSVISGSYQLPGRLDKTVADIQSQSAEYLGAKYLYPKALGFDLAIRTQIRMMQMMSQ